MTPRGARSSSGQKGPASWPSACQVRTEYFTQLNLRAFAGNVITLEEEVIIRTSEKSHKLLIRPSKLTTALPGHFYRA